MRFKDNRMTVNPDKYYLLIRNKKENFQMNTSNKAITKSICQKLFGG